jgi:hypothetical protein
LAKPAEASQTFSVSDNPHGKRKNGSTPDINMIRHENISEYFLSPRHVP